jgi:hypothetical protein
VDQNKQTIVKSSHGDLVTYGEHCRRVDEYLQQIKAEVTELTSANKSLTSYLASAQSR